MLRMAFMIYSHEIPIKETVDVCAIGGGPTGVAAAIAAAQQDASVFLVETQGCFGGAGASGLVTAFTAFTDDEHFMCGGIGREVYNRVLSEGAPLHGLSVPYQPETLKKIYDDMITEAGVNFVFFANMVDVVVKEGTVETVIVATQKRSLRHPSKSICGRHRRWRRVRHGGSAVFAG